MTATILRTAAMNHASLMQAADIIERHSGRLVSMRAVVAAVRAFGEVWRETGARAGDYWKVCAEAADRMGKR